MHRVAHTIPRTKVASNVLLLGRSGESAKTLGFSAATERSNSPRELITYAGDKPLITIAPTRAGKGTGPIVTNLLNYAGSTVVLDPKGENYLITARRRREMGQQIVKLDPFGVIDEESDSFNPLDMLTLPRTDIESDSQTIAELLARGVTGLKEPFWDLSGSAIHSGLIGYVASQEDASKRTLIEVINRLMADDVVYGLAVLLDVQGKKMPQSAYREIAALLQMPEVTRGGIIATAISYIKGFLSERVSRTLQTSSFSLTEFADGQPMTIYLIVPPERLHSHSALLRLWVGALLRGIFSRQRHPELKTLFLLDEMSQLGTFPYFETMVTLCAGYGVWCWSFWQDLAQLQSHYTSWRTILNNCAVQVFGINNRSMATQWGEHLEHSPRQLAELGADEQVLLLPGSGEQLCQRPNYLRDDDLFAGLYDANRFYEPAPKQSAAPSPRLP